MRVYTVHGPSAEIVDLRNADRLVFVRDGFHFWAMIFGPLWLIWHRLWFALLGYVIVVGALDAVLLSLRFGRWSVFLIGTVVAVLTGLEAGSLRRWTLSRGKWRQLDVVVGADQEAAERRFFERWNQRGLITNQTGIDRGAPPPTRTPGKSFSSTPPLPAGGIIGLFPEPGGSR